MARGGWVRSSVVGGVVGVLAGALTILLMESLGHLVVGTAAPPDSPAPTTAMFASVLVAWIVGSAVAGGVATYWARASTLTLGVVVGLILLAAAFSNLAIVPHPAWMMIAAVILMPTAAALAARLAAAREV